MNKENIEFVVTLFLGRKAMASFVTQSRDELDKRVKTWNATGEDYTCMVEKREVVLSEGGVAIPSKEYLTQGISF